MAILRDPQTGRVRAFLRDPAPETRAAADAVGSGTGQRPCRLFSGHGNLMHVSRWIA